MRGEPNVPFLSLLEGNDASGVDKDVDVDEDRADSYHAESGDAWISLSVAR